MYERSIKGVKYQLWGLNMLVVALLLMSLIFGIGGGLLVFILGLAIILVSGVALIMFIIGEVMLLLGSRELKSISLSVASLLMLVLSPFIFIFGLPLMPPVNMIIIHIAIWLLLASPVVSYLKLGGIVPGLFAIVSQTGLLIYTLMIIIISETGINIPLTLGILGCYFLFLEVSMVISYIRIRRMKRDLEIVEGSGEGVGEIDFAAGGSRLEFTPPRRPAGRTDNGFRVVEFEFSTTGSGPANENVGPSTMDVPAGRREPVMGKALDLDKILINMTRKQKREPDPEKYTIEEEEEIEVTLDDLYLDGQNLYQILKVEATATSNEIRKAYRRRAMLFHPDRNPGKGPRYAETVGREMRKLNKAKEILLDPARRSVYDSLLRRVS